MEAITILRELWRQRLMVAMGLALAIVIGIAMAYEVSAGLPPALDSRQYKVGIATAEMLVDSPSSQIADIGGGQELTDVTGLTSRARLLANLMAVSPLKEQIARRAGVDRRTLITSVPIIEYGVKKSSPSGPNDDDPRLNRLMIDYNEELPIISANTQAPTPDLAARISAAAVAEVQAYLKTIAATDQVPDARQLVISSLGPARSTTVVRGPRRLYAVAASVFVFGLWCLGIVLVAQMARKWREAEAVENLQAARSSQSGAPGSEPAATAVRTALPEAVRARAGGRSARPPVAELGEAFERVDRPERPARGGRIA